METIYNFAIYETSKKYSIFPVIGEKNYNIMSNKLRKLGYWFTVSYRAPKEGASV